MIHISKSLGVSEQESERLSAAERAKKVSSAEQANKWAVQANDWTNERVDQKKVNFVLDQLERCGFLHSVQHVSKNTSIVNLDIAKFFPFLLFILKHIHEQ